MLMNLIFFDEKLHLVSYKNVHFETIYEINLHLLI